MVVARGNITYIKNLERKDVNLMQCWGRHRDPLFYCYNFPHLTKKEGDYWFRSKTRSLSKRCFVVFNYEHQLVGYISLRNIKWFRKISELGIVFDPDEITKGYGTDGLSAFIAYYFEVMEMNQLELKVSIFNKRAQRCYEKCGFNVLDIAYGDFEDQSLPVFQDDYFIPYRHLFKIKDGKLQCQFIHMMITKKEYFQNKQCYPQYPPNTCV